MLGCMLIPVLQMQCMADQPRNNKTLIIGLARANREALDNTYIYSLFKQNIMGSFSIDDGNGSENVSFKMISRFFNLCHVYSNLLNVASVGEFPWS